MGARDTRVDAYIARSADFARPILEHLRALVHKACPDVEETIKWGMPHFTHHGILCSMAAFTEHCALGFWKGSLVLEGPGAEDAMGQFGRITSRADLPQDGVLIEYVKKAARLNEEGVPAPRTRTGAPKPELDVPGDLAAALAENDAARATFEGFSPSARREYVEWITEARTNATRQRRLTQAVAWMAEGKPRNWKYMKKKP